MPQKQGGGQKARTKKTSRGLNKGAKKQRPPELLLIAMGRGMAHNRKALR